MMRKKIAAGNWKMNKTLEEGKLLFSEIASAEVNTNAQIVMCVPFPYLGVFGQIAMPSNVFLGAQNCYPKPSGAFTGEVSTSMLDSVGVSHVIIGHSERREYFQEDNAFIAQKVDALLATSLTPIFCCGETLAQRQEGIHFDFIKRQLTDSLFHLSEVDIKKVVIAYEPIWAIGTGVTATTEQAQEVHAILRKHLATKYGESVANEISILYGGSVSAANAKELFACPDVDGGLVGGASLKAADFLTIVQAF